MRVFGFTMGGMGIGGTITLTLYFPEQETFDSYYKYGRTPDDEADHWYEFAYDGETGAEIRGNVITLHLMDGVSGDDDLKANGIVAATGGPGVTVGTSGGNTIGGGGGCFIGILMNGPK